MKPLWGVKKECTMPIYLDLSRARGPTYKYLKTFLLDAKLKPWRFEK